MHTDEDRASCDGYMGLWHRGGRADRIDVCVAVEWLILHEIAHACDSHAVDDTTRTAFMAQYPARFPYPSSRPSGTRSTCSR